MTHGATSDVARSLAAAGFLLDRVAVQVIESSVCIWLTPRSSVGPLQRPSPSPPETHPMTAVVDVDIVIPCVFNSLYSSARSS